MDLNQYRRQPSEREREEDLLRLLPEVFDSALDIGARDGYFSRLLAERARGRVVALDLEKPNIEHPRIDNAQGDITSLSYADQSFDLVFCAEVLEHVPEIEKACRELERVTRGALIIGVPFRQDTRIGRLTCGHCGRINPPNGHVNTFDEGRLRALFPRLHPAETHFVWTNPDATNALATRLMDWAGNPWGDYSQAEPCIYCGKKFSRPRPRNWGQRAMAKFAVWINRWEESRKEAQGNWIHIRFERRNKD